MDNLKLVLQWAQDLNSGEMIEAPDYTSSYLGFKKIISVEELDVICLVVNIVLKFKNCPFRVNWGSGEIRTVREQAKIDYLDITASEDLYDLFYKDMEGAGEYK